MFLTHNRPNCIVSTIQRQGLAKNPGRRGNYSSLSIPFRLALVAVQKELVQ